MIRYVESFQCDQVNSNPDAKPISFQQLSSNQNAWHRTVNLFLTLPWIMLYIFMEDVYFKEVTYCIFSLFFHRPYTNTPSARSGNPTCCRSTTQRSRCTPNWPILHRKTPESYAPYLRSNVAPADGANLWRHMGDINLYSCKNIQEFWNGVLGISYLEITPLFQTVPQFSLLQPESFVRFLLGVACFFYFASTSRVIKSGNSLSLLLIRHPNECFIIMFTLVARLLSPM